MEFPLHQRLNISRLEAFRAEIVAMRSSNWPYLKISAWLDNNHQILVTKEAVRQFCKVRGIGEKTHSSPVPSARTAPVLKKKTSPKFEFDDCGPIRTSRNER